MLVTGWTRRGSICHPHTKCAKVYTGGVIHWHLQPPCLFSFHIFSLCGSPPDPVPEPHFSGYTMLLC